MSSYKFRYGGHNIEIQRQETPGGRTAIFIDEIYRKTLACPEEVAIQIIDADKKAQTHEL
jgi:hypothetical protein